MEKEERLCEIIKEYRGRLQEKIKQRQAEMKEDSNEHYIVYHALGFSDEEGSQVDYQQNVGRFLYKYAGSLLEELAVYCLRSADSSAREKVKLPNTIDHSPKNVEIDCLVGKCAYEIKWKDATTDGDHIKKEHKRVRVIKDAGYVPIRLMFFEPNRTQAIRIQTSLRKLYQEVGGEYYAGEEAWEFLKRATGIDLKKVLEQAGDRCGEK